MAHRRFEFDRDKDVANRAKHGLSLSFGAHLFEDNGCLILPSFRKIDGENRFKAIGMVKGRLYTAIYVWRGDSRRFISVRRSNARAAPELSESTGIPKSTIW